MRAGLPLLWQALGNLDNGSNAGLCYVNANNDLGNTRWNIGSRLYLIQRTTNNFRCVPTDDESVHRASLNRVKSALDQRAGRVTERSCAESEIGRNPDEVIQQGAMYHARPRIRRL